MLLWYRILHRSVWVVLCVQMLLSLVLPLFFYRLSRSHSLFFFPHFSFHFYFQVVKSKLCRTKPLTLVVECVSTRRLCLLQFKRGIAMTPLRHQVFKTSDCVCWRKSQLQWIIPLHHLQLVMVYFHHLHLVMVYSQAMN